MTKEDPNIQHVKQTGRIPAYTTGRPLYGDDEVSYLFFGEAYGHTQNNQGGRVIQ